MTSTEAPSLEGEREFTALPAIVTPHGTESAEGSAANDGDATDAGENAANRTDGARQDTTGDTGAKPPKPAYTVEISVGACDWSRMIQELRRAVDHIEDHGEKCRSVWGGGGSHGHVHIEVRDVTEEAYKAELAEWWHDARRGAA